MVNYNLTMSVNNLGVPPILDVIQGDSGRNLIITIADMDITDCTARAYVLKPSGKEVYNEVDIVEEKIVVELTSQMLAEVGNAYLQITIYNNENLRVSTFDITLNAHKSRHDDSAVPSSNEFGVLDSLIDESQKVLSDLSTGILPIKNGGTGATTASQALTNLGLTATSNELNYCDGVTANIQAQINRIFCNHNPGYSSSQTGYIKLAHLEIKEGQGGNASHPLTLKLISRYINAPIYLTILFNNDGADTDDPTINSFNWYGGVGVGTFAAFNSSIGFIAHKTSAGVWDIYAKKISAWQAVSIENYSHNHQYLNTIDFTLATNEYLDTKPTENVVDAVLANVNATNLNVSGKINNLSLPTGNRTLATTEDITTTNLTGTLPINKGGTGATTAANALTNLGLTATAAELNYCDGVTSNIQAQLNGKISTNFIKKVTIALPNTNAHGVTLTDDGYILIIGYIAKNIYAGYYGNHESVKIYTDQGAKKIIATGSGNFAGAGAYVDVYYVYV